MTNGVKHLFRYFIAIRLSLLKYLFKSFLFGLFVFLFYYILRALCIFRT